MQISFELNKDDDVHGTSRCVQVTHVVKPIIHTNYKWRNRLQSSHLNKYEVMITVESEED